MTPEQALHMSVARFLTVALPANIPWSTFPAGGGGRTRGGFLKVMGLSAGWPDILIVGAFGQLHGIELKSPKGKVQPQQNIIHSRLRAIGAKVTICRSVDDVELKLREWGFVLQATVFPREAA